MRGRLALAAMLLLSGAHAQPPSPAGALDERIAQLEARVAAVESIRAIKRLQYAYGHYVEFGLWNDFADLFADDAVAHYPAGDLGRDAIRELFYEQVGGGQLGLADGRLYPHIVLQPVVTLDPGGETARGRWHVLTLLGGYGGNATWVDGVYENDYVREDGVWKIAELRTYTVFSGAYDSGWTNPRAPATTDGAICENYLVNDCTIAFHYAPDRPGTPIGPQPDAVATDTGVGLSELDRRVGRLLDENAVENLQHAYGYYVDLKRWDDVANLFAADATLELGLRGVYRGRDSIRRALDQFGPEGLAAGELNDHFELETIVTVAPDGLTANARGIDFALTGELVDGEYHSEWREAVYENVYIKEDGVWKISAAHLYPRFATDYALGWAEDARPPPVASEAFPPDEPPTVMHDVYPGFYIPPFHFVNPVTGAPPQYPDGAPPTTTAAVPTSPSVNRDVSIDAIERGLERAIAFDAVENLANAYNFYLDEFDHEAAGALIGQNGSASVLNAGVMGGRELIVDAIEGPRDANADGRPSGVMTIHQTFQPVIEVADDGASATFRVRMLASSGRRGDAGAWIAGIYSGAASAEAGAWRLDRMDLNLTWAADYTTGWASAAPFARISSVPFDYDSAVAALASATGALGQQITVEPLIQSAQDTLGQPLTWPESGMPEITGAIVTMAPGGSTGWHTHAVPTFGYLLSGQLTVEYETGETRVFDAGDGIVEAQNTAHNGHNRGSEPVRILVFYAGATGLDTSTAREPRRPDDFVALTTVVPGLQVELRYFGSNNFVGRPIAGYEAPIVYLTREAAQALRAVQQDLATQGLGLKVFDGYRPQRAVDDFMAWAADPDDTAMKATYYPTLDKDALIPNGYIAERSGHSRGSTVDVTLVRLDGGEEIDMGSPYDYFDPVSWPSSAAVPNDARANRMRLREVMLRHGFMPLEQEWWHFTLRDEPYGDTYFDFPIR